MKYKISVLKDWFIRHKYISLCLDVFFESFLIIFVTVFTIILFFAGSIDSLNNILKGLM